jgi:hypothetical protein
MGLMTVGVMVAVLIFEKKWLLILIRNMEAFERIILPVVLVWFFVPISSKI